MPPGFELPTADVQLWQPLPFVGPQWQDERSRGRDSLIVLGRLRPSATIATARAEMDAFVAGVQSGVTGVVRAKLFKGECTVVGGQSTASPDDERRRRATVG